LLTPSIIHSIFDFELFIFILFFIHRSPAFTPSPPPSARLTFTTCSMTIPVLPIARLPARRHLHRRPSF